MEDPSASQTYQTQTKFSENNLGFSNLVQRPKISPYISPCIALHIGTPHKVYYVAESLSLNLAWTQSTSYKKGRISLPDVDESTGHVLVHYLYTGAYQTLDDTEASPEEEEKVEFKRAIRTYIMARMHDLSGLQQLAEQKIEHFGVNLNIFNIIDEVKEDLSKLQSDDTWLHKYLKEKVEVAWKNNHRVFVNNDIFGRIDNVDLMRVLARFVVEVCTKELSDLHEEMLDFISENNGVDNLLPGTLLQNYAAQKPAVHESDESLPPTPESEIVLSVDDDQGTVTLLGREEKRENKQEFAQYLLPTPSLPEPEPIVIQADQTVTYSEAAPPEDDPWGEIEFPVVKKKSKKDKLKKTQIYEPEPEPEPEAESLPGAAQIIEEEEQGISTAVAIQIDLEEKKENTWDAWGACNPPTTKKKKKGKKGNNIFLGSDSPLSAEFELVPEPEPEPEPIVEEVTNDWNAHIFIPMDKKKKNKKKRGIFEETEAPGDDEICPKRVEHLTQGNGWESCASCRTKLYQIAF